MVGQTLALADAVLKDDYQGPVAKQINDECKLATQVAKNTKDFFGRRAIIPCVMTRNTGVGSRLENETLPAAGAQGTVTQIVPLRSHYGRIRLSRQVISRMNSDRGAFLRATALEMDGLKSDAARDYNRQLWGTSDGILATCSTTTAATTVVLATTTPEQVLVNLAEGIKVDIGDNAGATPQSVAANRAVSNVNFTTPGFDIDGSAVTTSSSNCVYRAGSGGTGASQRELTGVQTIVKATGTLFGISATTYFQWQSLADSNSGTNRPLSETLVAKLMMRTRNRSGQQVNQLWAEDQVYRFASNLLSAQKRFVNTLEVTGGLKGLAFAADGDEVPLMRDRDTPPNVLYGFATNKLVEYVEEDWKFEDLDGSVLQRSTDSTHSFEAIFFKFSEFATTQRNAHFVISDLQGA